jgi:outer membrane protein TolC
VFDGFRNTSTYSASQSTYSATVQELHRTRQEIAYSTRVAFVTLLRSQQIIEVRQSDLQQAREKLARARDLVAAGSAQEGTVYSLEADVANGELALDQAKTDAELARNNLALLLDLDPVSDMQVSSEGLATSVDTSEIIHTRSEFADYAALAERLVRNRPDLQAMRLRIESAASAVTAARSGYYPSLRTSLDYTWQKAGSTSSNDAQFNVQMSVPIFDGFRTRENVQTAEAQREQASLELRRAELQARSALQQALARLAGAERQLAFAAKALAAARQNRFSTDERYRVGVGSYADYLLASAQFLTAQINQVNAVYNYRQAIFEVRYQIGDE